jgi:hypothetical protein
MSPSLKSWSRYARPVGDSWRVDETYLKIKGRWVYLYRAVDKAGRTVDFLLSKRRGALPNCLPAGGYFGNRDIGSFEQHSDGLDLFSGEFGWAAASSTAGTRRFQTSNGPLPDQIPFEFGERCEDMKDKLSGW